MAELSANGFTYLAALIKNFYTKRMIQAVRLKRYIINYLEKYRQVEQIGENANVAVNLSWVESVTPGTATSVLPAPLNPEGTTFKVTTRHLYGILQVWHTEIKQADRDYKAFVNSQQNKLDGITKATQAEAEIYCYGDGGVTPRAICTAASNNSGVVTLTCDSTRLLRRGMPLDFYTSGGSPIANGTYVPVKAIIDDTHFTVDVGVANGPTFATAAANAYVYHANGKNQEPYGLEALIGRTDNNLFGVDRTQVGNEWYLPMVRRIDDSGSLVTATGPSASSVAPKSWDLKYLYQVLETLVVQRQAPKDKLAIFTSPSIRTKIIEDNRLRGVPTPISKNIDVWPEDTVEINGVPIIMTEFTRKGSIFIPCLSTFTKYETDALNWDEVGGMWKQVYDVTTGRPLDAKYAYFREIYQIAVGDAPQSATIYDCEGAYD